VVRVTAPNRPDLGSRGDGVAASPTGEYARVGEASFDDFVRPLDYPMFVLTVSGRADAERSGCLIGFATQCSIAPPRFLACLSRANHTYHVARRADLAAVHRLDATDRDLAALFGTETGDEVDKFRRCAWTEGPGGVPLLDRCSAWLVGEIDQRVDLGDHEGLVLRPIRLGQRATAPPLMFSAIRDLEAGHPA
jgi:flavin reductase (DIM6/NTAB) family NADH-FMN oxidoreductase RutF